MKLITKSDSFKKEFSRLIASYREYHWAVAWASHSAPFFTDLILNKSKIKKIVVGTHFYQTHPSFIQEFLDDTKVHFIQQPAGTFHPKIFLFYDNDQNWELLIGSANFTNEAFNRNSECGILFKSDLSNNHILVEIKNVIQNAWAQGKTFNKTDLLNYRLTWQNQQQKLKSLSGKYGNEEANQKPIYEISVIRRTWNQFIRMIRAEGVETLQHRLFVIEYARNLFAQYEHFSEMNLNERKFIAGIPNDLDNDGNWLWGVFGSMKGAGVFKNKIIENNMSISVALDKIPISGTVQKKQYDDFIRLFQRAFDGSHLENANNLATATRLLAMKRPDTFVCLASKNKSRLCKDFEIVQTNMDFERYWEEIILRIQDCHWAIYPDAKSETEKTILSAKAAFLDSLYYLE